MTAVNKDLSYVISLSNLYFFGCVQLLRVFQTDNPALLQTVVQNKGT